MYQKVTLLKGHGRLFILPENIIIVLKGDLNKVFVSFRILNKLIVQFSQQRQAEGP